MSLIKNNIKNLLAIIIPILVVIFNVLIVLFPYETIFAAKEGMKLWANNIVPSLLPFIIGTNILMGLGVLNFIGTILEPIMYKLFKVPGIGGFALVAGMTSGYPMGSKVVSHIRENKEVTKVEAQRLISFCNNSGPLFIIGVVGIGMFKNVSVGYFIMLIHYLAALITGFLFRYYKYEFKNNSPNDNHKFLLKKAFISMKNTKQQNTRSFGHILADSVGNAVQTILGIGGFIIIFCVLVEMIKLIFFPLMYNNAAYSNIIGGFIIGILEVTNGINLLASEDFTRSTVLAVAMLISFGGFSVHAQSVGFISKTDINIMLYIMSKVIHSIITLILGLAIYPVFNFNTGYSVEAFNIYNHTIFSKLIVSSLIFLFLIIFIFTVALILNSFIKLSKTF